MEKKNHLPIYGVGPIYGVIIIACTIVGIILACKGYLNFAYVEMTKIPFLIMGILICICGFWVWFKGAFRIDHYIETNELCTDGIYGIVRNPCYSGIMLMCSGALFIATNVVLLILPIIYWLFMTILMKNTEEKWLYKLYGEPYKEYCKRVNRCIPWFSKSRK
ncbi:MAG: isoprenylcysteine carboxylmethyltransferase family protein [bacterium]|nr:isoprenylcysteine carboxylmethyltransferase family protein [bacterium]